MERGGRGLTQVVQDFIHNYRLKPIFEEAVAWKHWGRLAGLVAGIFYRFLCFLASCVLSSNRKLFQLEPKRIRDVLNQENHPSNICEILRYYNLSGCSLPSGARCSDMGTTQVDVGRVRESHGSQ